MCGAGLVATFRRVTMGMARPALLALGLLVFIKASESFEVPALVGLPGSVRVLTSTIYQRLTLDVPPDIGSASAFGVLLLVLMAVLLQAYNRVAARTHRYQTVTGKGFRPRMVRLGRWRPVAGALVVVIPLIVVLVPVATILWAALLPYYQPFSIAAIPKLGVANFVQVLGSPSFRDSILNTLVVGAAAATLVTALSALAGWCVARRLPGSRLLDLLLALPLVFPAIVLGLAFLEMFVHAGGLVYGTLLSLVVASVVAYMPYGLRYAQLGVMQIHPELEEAATLSGARQTRAFVRIVLPLLVPALISCWLFVFLLAVRAVSLMLLLVGPDSQVVAVALFDFWNNGQIGELAALGFVWTVIMTVFCVAFLVLARRYQLPVT
jgi:iron(III) transport system permease protein